MAGRVVWFREFTQGERRLGRMVGYYYVMAQVVLECSFSPQYPIDPRADHITLTANFRKGPGWQYACVDVFLVDEALSPRDSAHPHACPRCGSPAFVLFRTAECTNFSCQNYLKP
jgi:hypothetical protein